MTEHLSHLTEKKKKAAFTPRRLCLGWLGLFCLFLMLRNSAIATEYITRGLRICAKTIIPSLFPFMVISELIVSGGIGNTILRPIVPLCKPILRLSESGCCAVLMGMFCGFPIGARCAMSALKSNQMTREEALRVILFSTNPSTAFLINAVGVSLWESRRIGVTFCVIVLLSQLIVGLLFAHVFTNQKNPHTPVEQHQANDSPRAVCISKLFTQAIGSSCSGILLVCAYVVFFSALSGTVNLVLDGMGASPLLKAIVACVLELSGGVSAACGVASQYWALVLCAFAIGWSGISVHCQLLSLCDGQGLHLRTYFLAKLLQGVLCAAMILAWIKIDPSLLIFNGRC